MKLLQHSKRSLYSPLVALLTALLLSTTHAAKTHPAIPSSPPELMRAEPATLDPKLVVYPYDPDYTYPILTQTGRLTHLEFEEDETIIGIYLADPKSWHRKTAVTRRDFFIQPKLAGLANTATIITNKRRYELMLKQNADQYYQRVSWQHHESDPLDGFTPETTNNAENNAKLPKKPSPARLSEMAPSNPSHQTSTQLPFNLERANFDYTVKGKAPFKPLAVFDDGRFTWLKMPATQEIPAIFMLAQDGAVELANFMVQGDYFVIRQMLEHGALLKLGKDEVRIYHNQRRACSFWGCSTGTQINHLWEH
ncbi:TrbG/VirB9 family P-type conjugative transfer protein [Mycoavidus sp. B2-EB]|uniref:TrbG/VirB9 family P-type conjugative transfer protein n=1 Tax=Mycoavidus sp. B2-EB TaxID=2651972 RepID=UPI001623FC3C|nr:TrbG/VirB9 family P-type conjugative transfer protein [Mycoavidus sp. B2-EB]BBO59923.1 P-type conjugative transfer protein VirB9 [Mycoavidus sp. B2-EB]